MTTPEYELCQRGVVLFVLGLVIGFAIPAFPVKQLALGAHQAALQSGTFLIAMGVLWPKLNWSARKSIVMARLLWISFCGLVLGLTCAAVFAGSMPAAGTSSRSLGQILILVLNAGSSILMLAVTALLLLAFRRKSA